MADRPLDPVTGEVFIENTGLALGPMLTKSTFERSELSQGATISGNAPWSMCYLGERKIGGRTFAISLWFYEQRLENLRLCDADPRFGRDWSEFNESREDQRKRAHESWIAAVLGLPTPRPSREKREWKFAWGSIECIHIWGTHHPNPGEIVFNYTQGGKRC